MSSIPRTCFLQIVLLKDFKDNRLGEKTFGKYTSNKGLVFDIFEEPPKLNNKKPKQPNKKGGKTLEKM